MSKNCVYLKCNVPELTHLRHKKKLKHEHVVPVEFGNRPLGLEVCMAAEQVQLYVLLLQRKTPQDLSLQQE